VKEPVAGWPLSTELAADGGTDGIDTVVLVEVDVEEVVEDIS